MPGQSRIDAAGALHHVIIRGIARRAIFFESIPSVMLLPSLTTRLTVLSAH
jgi:hypothetical protein